MRSTLKIASVCVVAFASLGLSSRALAQEAQLQVDRGPYYVGTPITLNVVALGFSPDSEPVSEVARPASGTLSLLGMTPNRSSSVVIINGRVERSSSVRYSFRYQYVASQPGRFQIGPFRVAQSGTERVTAPITLDVRDVPRSSRLEVELELGAKVAYVGSRLRASLEYRIDAELERNLVRSNLLMPLLDLRDAFRIEPDESIPEKQTVELATANGPLVLRATLGSEERDGRPWTVVEIPFFMVPLDPGTYALAPTSLTVDAGVSFQRDMFGGRRATQIEKLRAEDVARTLVVKELPGEGRPPSFAGAVGAGYSFEVQADRSVVQVGDPIELTLTLRGDGLLASASLPELSAEGLLPERDFNVPVGSLTGEFDGEAKVFKAVVRAKRPEVSEIPSLEFSYFDPQSERFETARSRPIALSVRPAEVVGAADVVAPAGPLRTEPASSPRSADVLQEPGSESERRIARELELGALDLSIVRDAERLVARGGLARSGGWWALGLYTASLGLLGGGFFERKRRNVDPAVASRREVLRASRELVREAAAEPNRENLRALAGALRLMRAEQATSADLAVELDDLLARCDAEVYAPASQPTDPEALVQLAEQGSKLADRLYGDLG